MKKPLQVGDRVATYDKTLRRVGVVDVIGFGEFWGQVFVRYEDGMVVSYHPKQLRRLIPKSARRRVWVREGDIPSRFHGNSIFVSAGEIEGPGWIEFVEVRPRCQMEETRYDAVGPCRDDGCPKHGKRKRGGG